MSNIEIVEVNNSKLLNQFINFPYELYKNDPYWVPMPKMIIKEIFDRKKNPFFVHGDIQPYLAIENNRVVGRIAAIRNDMHNKYHKDKLGFFGFFECVNDQDVANKLFATVKTWLQARGYSGMRGPANPSSNDEWGMLLDGFDDSPRIMMTYNPKYYLDLAHNYGLTKSKDLYAYSLATVETYKSEKMIRGNKLIRDRYNVKVRPINLKNFAEELENFKYVYNKAWSLNWGFVPLSDQEIEYMAKSLKPMVEEELVMFAEIDGKIIGAAMCLPDYNYLFKKVKGKLLPFLYNIFVNRRKRYPEMEHLRIVTLGLVPEFRGKGIDTVLYYEILEAAQRLGFKYGEASWLLEDNEMINRGMQMMNAKLYKRYRIYDQEF